MERVNETYRLSWIPVVFTEKSRIRYAAPPTGPLRWQPPQAPSVDRSHILRGDTLPQNCPQSQWAPLESGFNFTGNEDCLFLSVYAPPNALHLPVLVFIHGGGYGRGQGNMDMSPIINANNNNFVAVAIQYRVSAFLVEHEAQQICLGKRTTNQPTAGSFWISVVG